MGPTTLLEWPELMPRESYAIIYAATVGSVIGFLLYFYLVRNLDAMKVALIPVITPVFALFLGHYLNDEPLGMATWVGAFQVLLGMVVFEWAQKRKAYA